MLLIYAASFCFNCSRFHPISKITVEISNVPRNLYHLLNDGLSLKKRKKDKDEGENREREREREGGREREKRADNHKCTPPELTVWFPFSPAQHFLNNPSNPRLPCVASLSYSRICIQAVKSQTHHLGWFSLSYFPRGTNTWNLSSKMFWQISALCSVNTTPDKVNTAHSLRVHRSFPNPHRKTLKHGSFPKANLSCVLSVPS